MSRSAGSWGQPLRRAERRSAGAAAVVAAMLLILPAGGGGGSPARVRNSWLGADKVKHFFSSFFVQSISYGALRAAGARPAASLAGATAVSAAVGVAKEVHDRRSYGLFSAGDLLWDGAGIGTASVILARTK